MKSPFLLLLAGLFLTPDISRAANDSTYSDIDFDACEKLQEDDLGVFLKCEGLKDYPVHVKEGDLRQSVLFGPASALWLDNSFETFGPFNSTGTKVEWRLGADGRPFAAILRWFISNPDPDTGMPEKSAEGQVLVISRVAQPGDGASCVAGYVDALANADANTLAREVADSVVPGFTCVTDTPEFHGKRGEKAGEPSRSLPDD